MAETFGKTDKGTSELFLGSPRCYGCKFTSGSAGSLASISAYIQQVESYTGKIKCAIYDAALNKVADGETEEKDVEDGQDGWMLFNFITPPSVAASTIYYLVKWWNCANLKAWFSAGSANQAGADVTAYGAWPDSLSFDYTEAYEHSIFATYVEAPPPAVKAIVQAALISIPPLIVLPTLREILRLTGGC